MGPADASLTEPGPRAAGQPGRPHTRGVGVGVLGVDGCRGGWVGVVLEGDGGQPSSVVVGRTVGQVWERARALAPVAVVGVDIPIGLPDSGPRQADVLARRFVGPRASSVFGTPVRLALAEPTHAQASARSRELMGNGISRQAYALRPRIQQVEAWVREVGVPVLEVHPEVCFAAMAGGPLGSSKHSPEGLALRRALLTDAGIDVPDRCREPADVEPRVAAAADDVLDAAAVAWTARRYAEGAAVSMPDPPEVFTDGLAAAIWR